MRYLVGQEALQHVRDSDQGFVLMRQQFKLTSAQILALFATAVDIIGAPGANRSIIPVRLHTYKPAGVAYTIGGFTGLDVKYKAGTVLFTTTTAVLNGAGVLRFQWQPTVADLAVTENVAISIQAKVVAPTVGDQALYGELYYYIVNTTFPSDGKL